MIGKQRNHFLASTAQPSKWETCGPNWIYLVFTGFSGPVTGLISWLPSFPGFGR